MQKDKLNIGIVVDNEFNNDIRVRKEVNVLSKQKYNIFVLCFGFDNKEYEDIEGISINRIYIKRKYKDIFFAIQNRIPIYNKIWVYNIKKFIIKYNINVIHTHDLYMSKPVHQGIKASKRKIPLILDLHENFPSAINSYNWTKGTLRNYIINAKAWYKKERHYLKYPDKIIVLSNNYKNNLIQKYSFFKPENIIVYPNVIDFERFKKFPIKQLNLKIETLTIFYFGGVAERRGIFDAINVLKSVLEKGYNITLLIIGPVDKADKKRFFKEINKKEVKNNIKYISWIDVSELPSYLNISDICIAPFHKNPQHESGIANKLFQYMYGGKPIIASDCAPQKELIESNNCGIIFSNLDEFRDAIISLINNEELRKDMGKRAKMALINNFDPNFIDKSLIYLYSDLKNEKI